MQKMTRRSFLLRVAAPLLIIAVWLGLSAIGGPYFGRIDEVSSNDMLTFLPSDAESTRVNKELEKFRDSDTIPAIVVFESSEKLTDAQNAEIKNAVQAATDTGLLKGSVSPAIPSEDGRAAFVVLPLGAKDEFKEVLPQIREAIASSAPDLTYKVTGPAAFAESFMTAFAGIDGLLLVVALSVVFVILLVVYRSPILPIVTLLGAIFALSTAILLVWHLADAGIVKLNGQVQGILFILVIGAATDYALLYISRYREEIAKQKSAWEATKVTWKASWEPIVAAGGTVTLGLLCLLVSDLGSNRALGPVGGIGVAFAVFSALTFLPACLLLIGKKAFWPRIPKAEETVGTDYRKSHPAWSKVGQLVSTNPRRLWVGCTVLLLIACLFIPQLKAEGISQSDFVIGESEARDGQQLLDKHFAAGSGTPAYVITSEKDKDGVVQLLDKDSGIDGVAVTTTSPTVTAAPVGKAKDDVLGTILEKIVKQREQQLQQIRAGIEANMVGAPEEMIDAAYSQAIQNVPSIDQLLEMANPFKGIEPKVAGGEVLLQATLVDPADSITARETVARLRDKVEKSYPSVMIGGVTAIQLDTNTAADRDLRVIIPLILVVITIVLMLLLRAIVAPIILLLTTVVSFGATLGISALLFNHVWHFPGSDPAVIIYGFVFLVALGIDYNIFLMTRVREESIREGLREGTLKALIVTGGVITSAGIVLASTFAALYVIPILFLAQIAFIVAFGVLLDTLIVRSLIVPGLTLEVGRFMWWPSKLSK